MRLNDQHAEDGMVMAVMVPVVVMAIRGVAGCKTVVVDSIGIMMIMVVIVKVESRYRSFVAQMTMQALRRRPGELERNDEQEKDGYEAAHRRIVPECIQRLGAGLSERLINSMTPFDYYACYALKPAIHGLRWSESAVVGSACRDRQLSAKILILIDVQGQVSSPVQMIPVTATSPEPYGMCSPHCAP